MFSKYHICDKSATIWHHVQIHKKATFLQHIGNRWLRGICSPATGAKIYAKLFICLYAKMAKMSDFSNHNVFAYMLASCANLNFHPVYIWVSVTCVTLFVNCKFKIALTSAIHPSKKYIFGGFQNLGTM